MHQDHQVSSQKYLNVFDKTNIHLRAIIFLTLIIDQTLLLILLLLLELVHLTQLT